MKKVGKSDGYELGKIKRGGKGEKEKVQSTASTLTGYIFDERVHIHVLSSHDVNPGCFSRSFPYLLILEWCGRGWWKANHDHEGVRMMSEM